MSDKKKTPTPKQSPKKPHEPIPEMPGTINTVPPLRRPEIELPPYDPPVPNRAWTEMKDGIDLKNVSVLSPLAEPQRSTDFSLSPDNI
jgi:hypothetical protein